MKNKKIYLEILRIISCFFVIARHTNSFVLHSTSETLITWLFAVSYHILSMICVPIFFMISGALFLKRENTHKEMIKKCFFRLFIPLLFFSFIIHFKRNPAISLDNMFNFIKLFMNNQILSTYWFVYALMGLYIATPFLQKLCKNMKEKDYHFFIIYVLIFISIIPIFKRYNIISITSEFNIPLISSYVAYYIIGNYIFNYNLKTEKKHDILMIITIVVLIIFGTGMTYYDHNILSLSDYYYGGISRVTVFVPSILIAYLVRKKFDNYTFSNKCQKNILFLSSATFGIYLLHALFIDNLKFIYNFITNNLMINPLIAVILYQAFLFIILTVIVKIISKIPIVKKVV